MIYHIMTLFPDMVNEAMQHSMIGRARDNHHIQMNFINIRDYANNKHHKVDDYPYGGGAGMVMQPAPIYDAYKAVERTLSTKPRVIYLTPQGKTFNQKLAMELAQEQEMVLLCGHYEGIDERVIDMIVTDQISIGDYVLTGGELAAMVVIDAVSRLIPGVLNNVSSAETETFDKGLLEYPQYTRPLEFMGRKVPDVLVSGHHKNIEVWRNEQALIRTYQRRPDLIKHTDLSQQEKKILDNYCKNR